LLLGYAALVCVPLPGVNLTQGLPVNSLPKTSFSLAATGVGAAASAFGLVEVTALVVPRWRRLRVSFAGRRKLDRVVLLATFLLAALQVMGVVLSIEAVQNSLPNERIITRSPSLIGFCLFLGAVAAYFIARGITRFGLLNGFSVMMMASAVLGYRANFVETSRGPSLAAFLAHPLPLLAALVLPVVATVIALCAPERLSTGGAALDLPVPTSSLQPVAIVTGALAMLTSVRELSPNSQNALLSFSQRHDESVLLRFAGATLVSLLLAWLFSRPRQIAPLFERVLAAPSATRTARSAFQRALPATLFAVLTVTLCELVVVHLLGVYNMVAWLPASTAIVLDLVTAARAHRGAALSCAWRDHRPHAAAVARSILDEAKIPMHVFSGRQNTLFRIFGAYALTELWVPSEQAPRVTELLEARLGPTGAAFEGTPLTPPALNSEWNQRQRLLLGGITLLAMIICAVAMRE